MDASILIPTHARPQKLAACLSALARQSWPSHSFEIVVGVDGDDAVSEQAAHVAWTEHGGRPGALKVATFSRSGQTHIRHQLLPTLSGRIFISLNDDVVPANDFVARHLAAHLECEQRGTQAVILGHSPYAPVPDPNLLDVLVNETSMIFFYDAMDSTDRWRDWGYRYCYGLNFSAPLRAALNAGGFRDLRHTHFYEDLEIGFRLSRAGLPLLYRPEAFAPHEHRQQPIDLLRREFLLGVAAVRYARVHPEFTRELFGRDILDPDDIDYAARFIERERTDAARIERTVLELAHIPASSITGSSRRTILTLVAQQFTMLKRYIWKQGFLAEIEHRDEQYHRLTEVECASA